jgi:hypothetical protein
MAYKLRPHLEASRPALLLYLDTSVIGGYFDPVFMADTRELWNHREKGRFRFISSRLVFEEVVEAPERVRKLLHDTIGREEILERTAEAEALASVYIQHKIVPTGYGDDARHVAICTVARIEHLVSWNFKHLANVRREAGFNAVNLLQGYPQVRIITPTSLIHGYEEKRV